MEAEFAVRVGWEWDVETVAGDAGGDIIDHDHADKLSMITEVEACGVDETYGRPLHADLVLVRDTYTKVDGLIDRDWAYVNMTVCPWVLPERTASGHKVPKKYLAEFASWVKKHPFPARGGAAYKG